MHRGAAFRLLFWQSFGGRSESLPAEVSAWGVLFAGGDVVNGIRPLMLVAAAGLLLVATNAAADSDCSKLDLGLRNSCKAECGKLTVAAKKSECIAKLVKKAKATTRSNIRTVNSDDGYGYDFGDDLLEAGGVGANAALIRVIKPQVRRTLIRPRTNFVPEMLKSVEQI